MHANYLNVILLQARCLRHLRAVVVVSGTGIKYEYGTMVKCYGQRKAGILSVVAPQLLLWLQRGML